MKALSLKIKKSSALDRQTKLKSVYPNLNFAKWGKMISTGMIMKYTAIV